ncbi:MAG: alpha/beta fold hydrolase [Pseudomonadota bacterium]
MSGVALNFETRGDAGAPAVMLLHGFMSSNAQWLANEAALAARHRLVMVELWGHGDSPLPQDLDAFSVDAYVAQFEAIRRQLDISEWALIGQSYGAGLVLRYAQRCPDVCRRVVVTNSRSAFGSLAARPEGRSEDRDAGNPLAGDFNLRDLPYHPIHARRFPDEIKAPMVAAADRMPRDAIRHGGRLGADLHSVALLGELTMPVLLTNGRYEKSFQADADALRARYPELAIVDLEGGHSINIEAADGFDAAVLRFFGAD